MKKKFLRPAFKEEVEQHDRWMVSYADFITLLFAFFVVLYAGSSINASKYEQLSASMGAAFSSRPELRRPSVSNLGEAISNTVDIKDEPAPETVVPEAPAEIFTAAEKEILISDIDKLERHARELRYIIEQNNQDRTLLRTSLIEFETEKKRLEGRLNTTENLLKKASIANQAMQGGTRVRSEILAKVQRALSAQGIQIEIDTKNGLLRLPETLLFDSGRADFRRGGDQALKIVARNLALFLSCYSQVSSEIASSDACEKITDGTERHAIDSVLIEGHTDSQPISNSIFRDNWDLSVARAKNTYLELIKNEKTLEKLENDRGQPLVSFSAYAGRRPISANDSEIERRKNRRIDIRLIMAPPSMMTTDAAALTSNAQN
jgi:flagellar motor protein MotB